MQLACGHSFARPRNGFEVPAFRNAIKRAHLLGDPKHADLAIKDAGVRTITIPRPAPVALANVVCVEIEGDKVER